MVDTTNVSGREEDQEVNPVNLRGARARFLSPPPPTRSGSHDLLTLSRPSGRLFGFSDCETDKFRPCPFWGGSTVAIALRGRPSITNPGGAVRSRLRVALLCLFALVWAACGGAEPEPTTTTEPPVAGIFVTEFDVEWNEDAAVLLEPDEVEAALVSADHEAGRFVFESTYADLEQLQPGRSALLAGLGVYQITGRQETSAGVEISVEPGLLTDVIENGRITFNSNVMADPSAWETVAIETDSTTVNRADGGLLLVSAPLPGPTAKLTYKGNLAGFDTSFELNPRSGGFDVSLSAKRGSGNNIANVAMSGTVSGLRVETDILIEASSLSIFDIRLLNFEGTAEIQGGGAQIGIFNIPIQIPAKLAIPIPVGPIPFYIAISGGLEFESTLVTNTSAIVKGSTTFKGGVGATVNNGTVRHLATFDVAELTWETPDHVGTVKSGIGLLLDFPKVEFGLGHPKAAGLGAVFKFRSEVISNWELDYGPAGPVPVITGNCAETKVNFGATVHGEVKMLGVTLATDPVPLFGKLGDATRIGSAC